MNEEQIKNKILKLVGKENDFIFKVMEESERTRKIYQNFHSFHEAYAVIHEELDEIWQLVKTNRHKAGLTERQYKLMIKEEAVQVAAMCLRMVEDLCQEESKDE